MADAKKTVKKPRKKVKKKKKKKKLVNQDSTGKSGRNKKGQFKPGVSGNLKGCPKHSVNLATLLKKEMQEIPEDFGGKVIPISLRNKTWAEIFIKRFMGIAIVKGDVQAAKEIWQRVDGKVPDKIEYKLDENWSMDYNDYKVDKDDKDK